MMGGNVDDFIFLIGLRGEEDTYLDSVHRYSCFLPFSPLFAFVSAYLTLTPGQLGRTGGGCWAAEAESTDAAYVECEGTWPA